MIFKRILVIQTAFIGDVVLATSLLETLHKNFPEARIDILVRKGNEGLFDDHPFLSAVLIWKKKEGKYKSLWNLLRQIRTTRYDWVINLQRFGSTGFLTAFSGAPLRSGFDKNPFSRFFSVRVPHQIAEGIHEIDRNHALIERQVGPVVSGPRLYPSKSDTQWAQKYQKRAYVCIAPASVWFTKQYTIEGWTTLINNIKKHYPIYLLGGPSDQSLTQKIMAELSDNVNVTDLTGKLSFLQSAALLQGSTMNYVNDSAPMHICSAMNAPVSAIYCSTIPGFGYGPLSDKAYVIEITKPLDCRPCGLHGHKKCPKGHFNCATGIKPEQLTAVLNTSG